MFTGLVQGLGLVVAIDQQGPAKRLTVRGVSATSVVGDSIAINGCCLTVIDANGKDLSFEAGSETLGRTNLGQLNPGDAVNLEQAMRMSDRLGGHFVTGHIDAVGYLDEHRKEGDWSFMWFKCPPGLTRQIASKGSIAVDGISLTVVDVESLRFSVALIPHTLKLTTLGRRKVGDAVNLETDLLAKYVQRQLFPAFSSE